MGTCDRRAPSPDGSDLLKTKLTIYLERKSHPFTCYVGNTVVRSPVGLLGAQADSPPAQVTEPDVAWRFPVSSQALGHFLLSQGMNSLGVTEDLNYGKAAPDLCRTESLSLVLWLLGIRESEMPSDFFCCHGSVGSRSKQLIFNSRNC